MTNHVWTGHRHTFVLLWPWHWPWPDDLDTQTWPIIQKVSIGHGFQKLRTANRTDKQTDRRDRIHYQAALTGVNSITSSVFCGNDYKLQYSQKTRYL